jgi:hypothetical protein
MRQRRGLPRRRGRRQRCRAEEGGSGPSRIRPRLHCVSCSGAAGRRRRRTEHVSDCPLAPLPLSASRALLPAAAAAPCEPTLTRFAAAAAACAIRREVPGRGRGDAAAPSAGGACGVSSSRSTAPLWGPSDLRLWLGAEAGRAVRGRAASRHGRSRGGMPGYSQRGAEGDACSSCRRCCLGGTGSLRGLARRTGAACSAAQGLAGRVSASGSGSSSGGGCQRQWLAGCKGDASCGTGGTVSCGGGGGRRLASPGSCCILPL